MSEPVRRKRGRPPRDPAAPRRCPACEGIFEPAKFYSPKASYCITCSQTISRKRYADKTEGVPPKPRGRPSGSTTRARDIVVIEELQKLADDVDARRQAPAKVPPWKVGPPVHCDCCWGKYQLGVFNGLAFCAPCGYSASRCGRCVVHDIMFFPELKAADPVVPPELIEAAFAPAPRVPIPADFVPEEEPP